jgi:hypothetical protein
MTRDELVARTRQLIAEGERLGALPALGSLQLWLQLSDDLLRAAWGSMDRFHMAWLSVGRPREIVRGRPMTPQEEAEYVRDVAAAKNAVLTASLDAAERGLPFVGETGGVGPGARAENADDSDGSSGRRPRPSLNAVTRDVTEARRQADAHRQHQGPRAPRPEKLQR